MKILLIHHRIPWPPDNGRDKVTYNLIKTLAQEYQVTVLCPVFVATKKEDIEAVEKVCQELITIPITSSSISWRKGLKYKLYRLFTTILFGIPSHIIDLDYKKMHQAIIKICQERNFDCVQISSNVLNSYLKDIPKDIYKILGPTDNTIESSLTKMNCSRGMLNKMLWKIQRKAICKYETKSALKSDMIFFHSDQDRDQFVQYMAQKINTKVLPVATEVEDSYQLSTNKKPHQIIFVGGMGMIANADAATFLAEQIFPIIKKEIKDASLILVGSNPNKQVMSLANKPGIVVTGSVPLIEPYLQESSVFVCGVRAGRGIKTKTIEALRFGLPVVSTTAGVQGLWDLNGISISDDTAEFAAIVIDLLKNTEQTTERSRQARELYQKSYTFEVVAPKILEIYRQIATERASS